MSSIKSFTMIFLIATWFLFLYLGVSAIIWKLTGDINVLSLGVIVGSVIGICAMISLDNRVRYLTVIFIVYSSIHLMEFYY